MGGGGKGTGLQGNDAGGLMQASSTVCMNYMRGGCVPGPVCPWGRIHPPPGGPPATYGQVGAASSGYAVPPMGPAWGPRPPAGPPPTGP